MVWYISLAVGLAVIMAGVFLKFNLGLTMIASGLLISLTEGLSLYQLGEVAWLTASNRVTMILFTSVILLEVIGNLLKETGSIKKMIDSLGKLLGEPRLLTAALPALAGMLTVPGGAIISAPMVEEAGNRIGLSPARQAASNIWFRHVFYFMLPLFPSMILAAELAGVNVGIFALYNLSLTVVGLVVAFFTVFRGLEWRQSALPARSATRKSAWRSLAELLRSTAPLLVILSLVIGLQLFFPLALLLGISAAFFNYFPRHEGFWPVIKKRFLTYLLPGIKFKLAFIILGIMFFKQALDYTQVITDMAGFLIGLGIPLLILIFVVPVALGVITGDNSASIAIVVPLFAPMIADAGSAYYVQIAFVYFSSALGHIFAPVHPCFALTKEYFKASYGAMLYPLLPPVAAVTLLAFLQVLILGR